MNRILVVDDETNTLEALSSYLTRCGYLVNTAPTGEAGIAKVKAERFDVALVDIKLPGMDGITLLEQIKRIDSDVEVIMITGYASVESVKESMKKGAYDYIEKPLDINRIGVLIEKALQKRQLTATVALYEISKAIFSTIKMDELLKIIVDLAMKVLRADDSSIMLFDENEKLYIAFSHGLDETVKRNTRLAIGEKIAGWVAESRQPIILINGLSNDPRFADIQGRDNIKSAIVSPLLKNDKLLGILTVNRKEIEENFTKIDLYKAIVFASLASLALDNAHLYKDLQKLQDKLIRTNKNLETNEKNALTMVSQLKAAQEELKNSQLQLLQSAKLAALGQLAGGIAHEINNPLTGILNNAQLIRMLADKKDSFNFNDFKELIGIIEESARRCQRITKSLLDFSHASKGKYTTASLNEVIEKVLTLVTHELKLRNISIIYESVGRLPLVTGEPQLLQQVMFALINNARWAIEKKTPAAPGVITIKAWHNTPLHQVCISISDTGCGIPKENLKSLFEPFFTTKDVGEGTGLGLSLVYDIIKSHNGDISVESTVNVGTTFALCFPISTNT